MKTAIVTSDTSLNHNTGMGHPEQANRITAIVETLKKNKNLLWEKPSNVKKEILTMTHDLDYIDLVENSFPKKGISFLITCDIPDLILLNPSYLA